MSKTTPEAGRVTGSRLWHGAAIIALVVLAASLAAGLLWFFADPLNLPPQLLDTLDQRASVIGMFAGMLLGVAGFVVAVMALRAQTRADRIPAGTAPPETAAAEQRAPQVAAEGERSVPEPADAPAPSPVTPMSRPPAPASTWWTCGRPTASRSVSTSPSTTSSVRPLIPPDSI